MSPCVFSSRTPPGTVPGRRSGRVAVLLGILATSLGLAGCAATGQAGKAADASRRAVSTVPAAASSAAAPAGGFGSGSTTTTTTTTTSLPPSTTTSPSIAGPVTSPPLPPPGPGFVPGHVTAVGDSVMVDYQGALEQDVPDLTVTAAVSRGWTAGETVLGQLKAAGQLGAVVVVGLATNGPVTTTQFNSMMSLLTGASRVVVVNTRVDRPWQTANNAVLAAGVAAHPRAVLVNWCLLALEHPDWLYGTQTHLPIDGTGAAALAALVASNV